MLQALLYNTIRMGDLDGMLICYHDKQRQIRATLNLPIQNGHTDSQHRNVKNLGSIMQNRYAAKTAVVNYYLSFAGNFLLLLVEFYCQKQNIFSLNNYYKPTVYNMLVTLITYYAYLIT